MKYLFLVIILFSCVNKSRQKENAFKNLSVEKIDTVKTSPTAVLAEPDIFERAFTKGSTEKIKDATLHLFGANIGTIKVESGQIVACDPMLIEEYGNPFTQTFPIGEFPVQLAIAELDGEQTIAFARIYFSDEPPVQWKYALLKDQEDKAIAEERAYGYVVDHSIGAFMDYNTRKVLDSVPVKKLYQTLLNETAKHQHNFWRYAISTVASKNLAVFYAGLGDGNYSTYIGYDAKGQPCRLLTDFGIFDWRKK